MNYEVSREFAYYMYQQRSLPSAIFHFLVRKEKIMG
jgi:hypothetical protein